MYFLMAALGKDLDIGKAENESLCVVVIRVAVCIMGNKAYSLFLSLYQYLSIMFSISQLIPMFIYYVLHFSAYTNVHLSCEIIHCLSNVCPLFGGVLGLL
jgi:hypothetical protein